ncbi:hypothetical protein JCM11641_000419 [Rhodosporidiobolus odoratus]
MSERGSEPPTEHFDVEMSGARRGKKSTDEDGSHSVTPCPAAGRKPVALSQVDQLASSDHDFEFDLDEDIKPLVPSAPPKRTTTSKARAGPPEVIDLLDESDGDDDPQAPPATSPSHADLTALRSIVPDVDPSYLLKIYVARDRDVEAVVDELIRGNYPLRGKEGEWKLGYAPRDVPEREQDNNEEEEEEQELEDEETRLKKKIVMAKKPVEGGKKDKGKGKAKTPEKKKKKQRRVSTPLPGEDDEVDQLASDDEREDEQESAEEEEIEKRVYTKASAVKEAESWLDTEERGPGTDNYKKAALIQLYTDWSAYAELQIRNSFESEKCMSLYAPTWFELARLKKEGVLIKLKSGPRDMSAPIRGTDGEDHARPAPPPSQELDEEVYWLAAFIEFGGKALVESGKIKKTPAQKPKAPNKEKPKAPKKAQSVSRQALKGGSKITGQQRKKAEKRALDFGLEDEGECCDGEEDGWKRGGWFANSSPKAKKPKTGESSGFGNSWVKREPGVEPFSGVGRRLG